MPSCMVWTIPMLRAFYLQGAQFSANYSLFWSKKQVSIDKFILVLIENNLLYLNSVHNSTDFQAFTSLARRDLILFELLLRTGIQMCLHFKQGIYKNRVGQMRAKISHIFMGTQIKEFIIRD